MCLTPRHGNLSQGCITISVPRLCNPIRLNPVFETPERSSTTYGVTQIIPQVVIGYREAETLHNLVFIDLKSVRQWEVMIRLQNVPRDAYLVMLPFWKVFEGCVMLSST
jgi:hypothetical protein